MKKRILIACEESATVRTFFEQNPDFEVWSCDILPSRLPGNHYQGDIRDILDQHWDLIIAHPPCKFLCNSGVRHLYNKDGSKNTERWSKMAEGAEFFRLFLNHPCELIAIENSLPHKHSVALIGRKYDQAIQPWQFGHTESKKTCFWLKGLPKLVDTNNVYDLFKSLPKSETHKVHRMPPGPERSKKSSKTYEGIAEAMYLQWSPLLIDKKAI